jgi:cytoskeletal protein CcmA (bactofilin family)
MFNKEESKNNNSTGSKTPTLNMVSEGTRIKGDIHSENDIRIAGFIDGQATSKGKVIINSNGHIEGNIEAKDADIAGKLDGEIFISGKLIIRQSAQINGDIHTKTLLVEEGAQIHGTCKMGVDGKKESPKRPEALKETEKTEKETSS